MQQTTHYNLPTSLSFSRKRSRHLRDQERACQAPILVRDQILQKAECSSSMTGEQQNTSLFLSKTFSVLAYEIETSQWQRIAVRHALPPTRTSITVTQKVDSAQWKRDATKHTLPSTHHLIWSRIEDRHIWSLAQKIDSSESWMTAATYALHSSTYFFWSHTAIFSFQKNKSSKMSSAYDKMFLSFSHRRSTHLGWGKEAKCALHSSKSFCRSLPAIAVACNNKDVHRRLLVHKGEQGISQTEKQQSTLCTFPKYSLLVPQHL